VIERPGTGGRPKTAETLDGIPTLEVPIPSYKLGTPRFSMRGTAFLRGSSYYTTNDEGRSSVFTHSRRDASNRSTLHPDRMLPRRHSHASPQPRYLDTRAASSALSTPLPSPNLMHSRTVIEPAMFDKLTFKPMCDDRSLVRYSGATGTLTAATPPRLVAEITSPSFVDYDLLSDFFLTFRTFLTTSDLLAMLIARLRWALAKNDEVGMVVRVRTFVALRHWILNYFMDDYVVDYELRKSFCDLLNTFVAEIVQNPSGEKNQLKILGELKKCWRRTCALYWDGPDFAIDIPPEAPIAPGGIAGSREPDVAPNFWDEPSKPGPPRLESIFDYDYSVDGGYNFFAEVSQAGHIDSLGPIMRSEVIGLQDEEEDPPLSPRSMMSDDVISCSFPTRSKVAQLGPGHALGAHPIPASSRYDSSPPVAYTPKGVAGKRVRPAHAHKRSASFSDSLRDGRIQPVQTIIYKSTALLMALPYAGSLVRGNLFPPGQAYVEYMAPATPAENNPGTTKFQAPLSAQRGPSAMSGPGMKKLMGSVRRALKAKNPPSPCASPTNGSFPQIAPVGVRGVTVNRLPGTAIVPQARARNMGAQTPMRIDVLGAGIAEDFKKAVREDAEAETERQELSYDGSIGRASGNEAVYPSMRPDTTLDPQQSFIGRSLVSGITAGSQSIMIFDDTIPADLPVMTGALPINPSTDTFTDPYMQRAGGPTPPSTPPEQAIGSPRRSSHLLGEQSYERAFERHRSLSLERTPSLVLDLRDASELDRSPSHRPIGRPSMPSYGRSFRSNHKSNSLRRYASYQSGFTRHATERSFDATTFSGSGDRVSNIPAVAPLHVLRRRPGGDLRAVTNVGDLNITPLRRTRSIGSITTYSDSVRSSYLLGRDSSGYVGVVNSVDFSEGGNTGTFSLGALAEALPKPHVSLFSTHPSQPVMRPSFEKEAAKLAQIPDDVDDDGGVESALLKLEGKFDDHRRSQVSGLSASQDLAPSIRSFGADTFNAPSTHAIEEDEEEEAAESKQQHGQKHIIEKNPSITNPLPQDVYGSEALSVPSQELKPTTYQPNQSMQSQKSQESYSSIPLLQREFSVDGDARMNSRSWRGTSILRGPSDERRPQEDQHIQSPHASFEFITETASLKNVRSDRSHIRHQSKDESFLESDSDGDDHSDLSSEMSVEVISAAEYSGHGLDSSYRTMRPGTIITDIDLPAHPLRQPSSPPGQFQPLSLPEHGAPQLYASQLQRQPQKIMPPTPEVTPTLGTAKEVPGVRDWNDAVPSIEFAKPIEASRKTSAHLPFILAFDSKVLAQQFTLVEKDALNEIDWKELIDMRWKNTSTISRSWVNFLRTQEARGVEVVIARFNIMVKWAVSECVLTQNLDERVQCIIKCIHIAAHCRRYRNYATMYQLTVALTCNDISRLTNTWKHVPANDVDVLRELEALVQPTRNFHNLRAEMEGSGADKGCIPFVGIYTHDLLFNAQRPSQIASTPTSEPLINFERCRTTATIVKNLLRLLEASSLYRFQPIEGITERCLWMAALSDDEIKACGEAIE